MTNNFPVETGLSLPTETKQHDRTNYISYS